jgi:hypothetical protein
MAGSGKVTLFLHFSQAEQYTESVASWAAASTVAANVPTPSDVEGLETAIRTHQSLYEAMCQAYTEVSELKFCNSLWNFRTFQLSGPLDKQKITLSTGPLGSNLQSASQFGTEQQKQTGECCD